jgi:hypothetical protein
MKRALLTFLILGLLAAPAAQAAGPPQILETSFAEVTTTSATLQAKIDPNGKATKYHFEYGPADCSAGPCTSVPTNDPKKEPQILGSSPATTVSVQIEGLSPATTYHFRVVTSHVGEESVPGPDTVLRTFGEEPVFGLCPNDQFRTGPSARLPDCRAYEQASPVNKNGADAFGEFDQVQAASGGDAVAYYTTAGLPGAVGAQDFQTYLSRRTGGKWGTSGVYPPAADGPVARNAGWTPDLSFFFSVVADSFNGPWLFQARDSSDGTFSRIVETPFILKVASESFLAGASVDGSLVYFQTRSPLLPGATLGRDNLYLWNRATDTIELAGVLPNSACGSPPCVPAKGSFAGPYDWFRGSETRNGGVERGTGRYPIQAQHTISTDGSRAYFTDAGTGQLYLREGASGPGPETVHVSASERRPTPDPLGPRPAAFMAATPDGSKAFFTSPEMLTADAKTGPEQGVPAIGRADIDGKPESINPDCIPARATGLATNSEYIYWADPVAGSIGRAELGCGGSVESDFILTGDEPQWVAVDSGHIYWTSGSSAEEGVGEIGRADISGEPASVEPSFIPGRVETGPGEFKTLVTNPQGIAVNSEYIYWANDGTNAIARAQIGGDNPQPSWHFIGSQEVPQGVAVDATHIYWTTNNPNSWIARVDLDGSNEKFKIVNLEGEVSAEVRGIALDGSHLYWVQKAGNTIGRANLDLGEIEKAFIAPEGTLHGLAVDSTHIYWTVNGEAVPNTGNDLYEFDASAPEGQRLTDLAPDPADPNGAEVKGVLGSSSDGSYVYFAANGDLDGPGGQGSAGDCTASEDGSGAVNGRGNCNLYLAHAGGIIFIAPLVGEDAANWQPNSNSLFPHEHAARVSSNGRTLLFRSRERLTSYVNGPEAELYLYRLGEGISCISCSPSGEAPVAEPHLFSIQSPTGAQPQGSPGVLTRNLSASGGRVFFETAQKLVAADTDSEAGCAGSDCQDVYEWEAAGEGTCEEASAAYSGPNDGCLYLLSGGTGNRPAYLADADEKGDNVFIFTRAALVPQDEDGSVQDVYDVRAGGGIASQQVAGEASEDRCENEACKPGPATPPGFDSPSSGSFQGPGNPEPKPPTTCPKGKRLVKRHGRFHCAAKKHPKRGGKHWHGKNHGGHK